MSRDRYLCFGCDKILFDGSLSVKDSRGICIEADDTYCKGGYDGDHFLIDKSEAYFIIFDGGGMMPDADMLFVSGLKIESLDEMFGLYCRWVRMSFYEIIDGKGILALIGWVFNFHNSKFNIFSCGCQQIQS